MTTEYHEIGFMGRANKQEQSFLVRKDYKKDYRGVWIVAGVIFVISTLLWLLVGVLVPPMARAEQTGPRNNKEVCQDMKKNGGYLPAGHMWDTVLLCKRLGINL